MPIEISGNAFVSTAGGAGGAGGGNSLAIENCKGYVHVFSESGTGEGRTSGFYELDPPIPDADGAKCLLLGVPLQFQEITQPTVTLDDKRVLYVYGTAWNEVSVTGVLLLGTQETRGDQLTKLKEWYEANRVGELEDSISLSLGTTALDVYVIGMTLGEANTRNNTQQFSIRMLTADLE